VTTASAHPVLDDGKELEEQEVEVQAQDQAVHQDAHHARLTTASQGHPTPAFRPRD
jgi:hypothetical protein